MKNLITLLACALIAVPSLVAQYSARPLEYHAPLASARHVSPATSITIRPGPELAAATVSPSIITVTGSSSGVHGGRLALSSDRRTLVFYPTIPFAAGEHVRVVLADGLRARDGRAVGAATFSFTTDGRPRPAVSGVQLRRAALAAEAARYGAAVPVVDGATPAGISEDIPNMTVVALDRPAPGRIYLSNLVFNPAIETTPHLMILDNDAVPVYAQRVGLASFDLKRQPDGRLTYFDGELEQFVVLDTNYQRVATFNAGNGFETDVHELLLLDNGHALLMGLYPHKVDMSAFVPGGDTAATVLDMCIQELDAEGNVVFEWRSADHIEYTDAQHEDLTASTVDHVHPNSLAIDHDGNILMSSRHLDEVTKISRTTGEIMWRLGGKNNQFTFVDDPHGFSYQHDARRLDNGNILLYDNGNFHTPKFSRAVEYRLDETARTATLVWQYRHSPEIFSYAMGNAQRLPNGNTLIGWGANPTITEVRPDGSTAFEMLLPDGVFTYRAFRLPAVTSRVWTVPVGPSRDTVGIVGEVDLTWKKTGGAASYQVQVALDSSFTSIVHDQMDIAATSFNVSGLDDRTVYYWRVRAHGDEITGMWSETQSFLTDGAAIVQSLVAPPNNGSGLTMGPVMQWAAFPGARAYRIQMSLDLAFRTLAVDTVVDDRSLWMSTIERNARYYWRVRPVLDGGEGNWSQNWSFRTASAIESQLPYGVSVVSPSNLATIPRGDVRFEWQADEPIANATTYRVEVAASADFSTIVLDSILAPSNVVVDAALLPMGAYWWRVRATNAAGEQYASDIAAFSFAPLGVESADASLRFSVGPNPSSSIAHAHITLVRPMSVSLRLVDASGRVVESLRRTLGAGDHVVPLRVDALPSGPYMVVVGTTEGTIARRFVVQH